MIINIVRNMLLMVGNFLNCRKSAGRRVTKMLVIIAGDMNKIKSCIIVAILIAAVFPSHLYIIMPDITAQKIKHSVVIHKNNPMRIVGFNVSFLLSIIFLCFLKV
jgi:hypothetical protein